MAKLIAFRTLMLLNDGFLLFSVRPQMVDFGSEQGLSNFEHGNLYFGRRNGGQIG